MTKHKVGEFIDRRFGQNDTNMTVEEKMLERFAKEKQKKLEKSAIYQLESDNEELTHFGQSLSNVEDHDPRLSDAEDVANIDSRTVDALHFGGFDETGNSNHSGKKPYAEIVKEIIAKSKYHKMERQKEKEENEAITRQLNDDFGDIRGILIEDSERKAKDMYEETKKMKKTADDYDVFVHELASERKARPTDRLKTDEEIAAENAMKLQKLEKERLKRMNAVEDSDNDESKQRGGDDLGINFDLSELSDDASGSEDEAHQLQMKRKVSKSQPLMYKDGVLVNGEDFTMIPKGTKKESDEESTEDEENSEEESQDEEDDSEASVIGTDDETEASSETEQDSEAENVEFETQSVGSSASDTSKSASKLDDKPEENLPYTFDAPESHADLAKLFCNRDLDQQLIIIDRLRVLYHPSLAVDNKLKLQTLLQLLVEHVERVFKFWTTIESSEDANTLIFTESNFGLQNLLKFADTFMIPISSLATQFPEKIVDIAIARLKVFHDSFNRRPVNLSVGKSPQRLVQPREWMMCQLFSRLFSASDFKHPVITPMYLLMGRWLVGLAQRLARIPSEATSEHLNIAKQDAFSGLLICQIYLECQQESKRWMPEAGVFLHSLLRLFCVDSENNLSNLYPSFLAPNEEYIHHSLFSFSLGQAEKIDTIDVFRNNSNEASHCAFLFEACCQTVLEMGQLYAQKEITHIPSTKMQKSADSLDDECESPETLDPAIFVAPAVSGGWCWVEIMQPFIDLLHQCKESTTAQNVEKELSNMAQTVRMQRYQQATRLGWNCSRIPLQWQKQQTVSIRQLTPKFREHFNPDHHYEVNPDIAEKKKLEALHRRELKGAVRELRKDAAFLAEQKLRQLKDSSSEYQNKMKRVYGMLGNEQGERKAELRASTKKRK